MCIYTYLLTLIYIDGATSRITVRGFKKISEKEKKKKRKRKSSKLYQATKTVGFYKFLASVLSG